MTRFAHCPSVFVLSFCNSAITPTQTAEEPQSRHGATRSGHAETSLFLGLRRRSTFTRDMICSGLELLCIERQLFTYASGQPSVVSWWRLFPTSPAIHFALERVWSLLIARFQILPRANHLTLPALPAWGSASKTDSAASGTPLKCRIVDTCHVSPIALQSLYSVFVTAR